MQANGRRGILSVLRVWRLANGRLERPNNRGLPAKLGVLHAGVARVGLIGVPFPCGAGRTCRGLGAFGTFEAWQMAALNAYKRSHCCGRGVPFPCGGGQTFGGVGRLGGFEASQTAAFGGFEARKRQPIKEAIAAAVGCSWAIAVALWWRLPAVWAWQGNRRYVQANSRLQHWNSNGWPARADGHKAWWKLPRGSCREAP